ncbi:YggS family pyridoxal phosphate-dependent enzyme [Geochorda subterranea]|uniref:Pyridoxal phosphate homeostasis protein n=1 Tax=Geochorda subterranea TaxID=3109564 RepID=A0ABZ1BRR6_9FIRM|nr:YggS family pyridoxal phosphate-dependent enzyme [Limnochorda sp. LNt]WRP15504.1 YggS family pyridoxal phosphate-dependent enzyme [Limnochorda sp. LNt]
MESIANRLASIRQRIEAAAHGCGRNPAEIGLVAVSKGVDPDRIQEAYACGLHLFGENRVQELVAKVEALQGRGLDALEWHMVGHLQRNKARHVARHVTVLHSLDSLALAQELDRHLSRLGRTLDVLVEVNVSGEPTKWGVHPDEAPALVRAVASVPTLRLVGLMTVGPRTDDPQAVRAAFRTLRHLRDRIRDEGWAGPAFAHLSMGMSSDFEVAIEEGATLLRIGTALFGPRAG